MIFFAPSVIFPIAVIFPSLTATSARYRGPPVPSTMVPFRMTISYDIVPSFGPSGTVSALFYHAVKKKEQCRMLFSYFLADPYAPSHGDDTSDETARHSRHGGVSPLCGALRYRYS